MMTRLLRSSQLQMRNGRFVNGIVIYFNTKCKYICIEARRILYYGAFPVISKFQLSNSFFKQK